MKINENENNIYFDVDDTLVMWNLGQRADAIDILCPYTNENIKLVPHKRHIKILKDQHARGFNITVWSAGGWLWAKTVVEALGIVPWVDEVRSKNIKFCDDLPASEVLVNRFYIDFNQEENDEL